MGRARRAGLVLLAALAPLPGRAQYLSADEGRVLSTVTDHACLELRDDLMGCEAVIILGRPEAGTADVLIYPNLLADAGAEPLALARGAAFFGRAFGQQPRIEPVREGVFRLVSEQVGIGRSPWEMSIGVAWRDGTFVVAGLTYTTWDRTDGRELVCDVNFRTGDWTRIVAGVEESGEGPPVRLPFEEWHHTQDLPAPCRAALRRFHSAE